MTTVSHEPAMVVQEKPRWSAQLLVPEMWAALAIVVMWLSVLFTAIYGPDIVSTTATTNSTVPSAVVVAVFAFFGTWVVARYGFRRERTE